MCGGVGDVGDDAGPDSAPQATRHTQRCRERLWRKYASDTTHSFAALGEDEGATYQHTRQIAPANPPAREKKKKRCSG